jgi:hypothetical protein
LLISATWLDGAFDLRYWAPIAMLGLVTLVAAQLAGGIRIDRGPRLIAVAAIWAFAGWTLLSAAWAESPALAWEGAARTILYATLVTLGLAVPTRRQALAAGSGIVLGITVIMLSTLLVLFVSGAGPFLAGRLDDPIGYRNGTATLFAFVVWPLLGVAAARGRNPTLRSGALACAVLGLGLAYLTQSRGVLIGLVVGGLVSLAIGPDRLRRAWLAVAAVGAVAVASSGLLTPYETFQDGGVATDADVHEAALALTVLVLATFALGLLGALWDNGLRVPQRDLGRRVAAVALGLLAVVAVAGALIAIGSPSSYASDKWDEFTELGTDTSTGSTRLGSVGGQRYDLWSVAWSEFESEPVTGVGEGNYPFDYYRERRSDRNLSDPHSLPFRLLAETGLVGVLLFGAFLVSIGIAIARAARSSPESDRRRIAGLAAAGAVVLGQSATDWLWLIPTLTGLGLLALALAAVPTEEGAREEGSATPRRSPGSVGASARLARYGPAVPLAAAAVVVALLFLSDLYVRQARSNLGISAQDQLEAAEKAEDLNPVSVTPLYLQASALESMGDRAEARSALLEALEQEPDNFVTLAVLGDLEVRAGDPREAREYYRRASKLNPLDTGLQELAQLGTP